jgi:hypothetical protein
VLFKNGWRQGISVNHYYNPNLYEGNKVPAKVVIKDMIDFYISMAESNYIMQIL